MHVPAFPYTAGLRMTECFRC